MRILIAEDNSDAARTLSLLLRLFGHRVETVCDGEAAVLCARAEPPDVLLLDVGLPKKDGFQVASELRTEHALHNALIVATSAYDDDENFHRAREVGIDHYLVKPVDNITLLGLLARLQPRR